MSYQYISVGGQQYTPEQAANLSLAEKVAISQNPNAYVVGADGGRMDMQGNPIQAPAPGTGTGAGGAGQGGGTPQTPTTTQPPATVKEPDKPATGGPGESESKPPTMVPATPLPKQPETPPPPAYNGPTRDDWIASQNAYQEALIRAEQIARETALRQAVEKAVLSAQQSANKIQNEYTAGANRISEQIVGTTAEFAAALNKLREEQARQLQGYSSQSDQASVSAAERAMALRELLATKGLTRSGTAVGQEMGVRNQRDQQLQDILSARNLYNAGVANRATELGTTKANLLAALANRAAELEQARAGDISNLEQQIDMIRRHGTEQEVSLANELAARATAAKSKNALDYEDLALRMAGVTGNYYGQPTLAARDSEWQRALAEAGLAGVFNGQPTQAAKDSRVSNLTKILDALGIKMPDGAPTPTWLTDGSFWSLLGLTGNGDGGGGSEGGGDTLTELPAGTRIISGGTEYTFGPEMSLAERSIIMQDPDAEYIAPDGTRRKLRG